MPGEPQASPLATVPRRPPLRRRRLSGWVGLGQLCGFGVIRPLPGIWDAAHLNTAITLPIGVEAYGSYALAAWLDSDTPEAARRFARRSAVGSLTLGVLGQVAYHLLSAAHAARAPWPVVVLVSSLPVVVLGFDAALSHLLRGADGEPENARVVNPEVAPSASTAVPAEPVTGTPESAPVEASATAPQSRLRSAAKPAKRPAKAKSPADLYAAELAAGGVPSLRRIRADFHVGQPKAQAIQTGLVEFLKSAA